MVTGTATDRSRAVITVVALLALSLFGCTGQTDDTIMVYGPKPVVRSPGPPQVHAHWQSCVDEPSTRLDAPDRDGATLPLLTGTFDPVAAVICSQVSQQRPDGGTDEVLAEDRVVDVAPLLTALRLPDVGQGPSPCTLYGIVLPWVALLDTQGHWVRPGTPDDDCNRPRQEVIAAINQAHGTRIATHVLYASE